MTTFVYSTASPHVVIVGQRRGKEWFYLASEPMTMFAAEQRQRSMRVTDDQVVLVRPEADPEWRKLNLVAS